MKPQWKKVEVSSKFYLKETIREAKRRWEDNVIMNLKEIGINTRNWVDSAQDRDYWRALVVAAPNLQIP